MRHHPLVVSMADFQCSNHFIRTKWPREYLCADVVIAPYPCTATGNIVVKEHTLWAQCFRQVMGNGTLTVDYILQFGHLNHFYLP